MTHAQMTQSITDQRCKIAVPMIGALLCRSKMGHGPGLRPAKSLAHSVTHLVALWPYGWPEPSQPVGIGQLLLQTSQQSFDHPDPV